MKLNNAIRKSQINHPVTPCGCAVMLVPHMKSGSDRKILRRTSQAKEEEANGLARSIGLEVIYSEIIFLPKIRPSTLFGKGKVASIAEKFSTMNVDVVIVDGNLTALQQRNLEQVWVSKVIDRTGLILEIFGARARTREGKLQVELAALTYQRSRLVRSWTHLERQRGGFGFLGGPGESQIEADRRHINKRIIRIRGELKSVRKTRALHRSERRKIPFPVAALVGYTNAGKSTLFSQMTGAKAFVDDLLFATLDPTMRVLALPNGLEAIISDTVGFISELPLGLVAAFSATLEEVREADLIIHVRDVSNPDSEAQKEDVLSILGELGLNDAATTTSIEVLNKIDLLTRDEKTRLMNQAARNENAVPVSAINGEGCENLLTLISSRLSKDREIIDVSIEIDNGADIAWLYRHGEVLRRVEDSEFVHFRVGLHSADWGRFSAARSKCKVES